MVASLEAVPTGPTVDVEQLNPAAAAGVLLEQGMHLFSQGEYEAAASAFNNAIDTDRLNNAGRALAYWHIYVSEEQLGNAGRDDALASFVVVAEDVLEVRERMRYAVNEAGDFVDRFELPTKLLQARAILSAEWAGRSHHFGRSTTHPVPIRDPEEMDHFLARVAPCVDGERRDQMSREVVGPYGASLHQVTVTCGAPGRSVDYYFDLAGHEMN